MSKHSIKMKNYQKETKEMYKRFTSWGSTYALYLRANTIEVVGIIYAYEPTTTEGSLVPNKDCKSVLNPETKSNVCITLAFSACDDQKKNSSKLNK